MCLHPSSVDPVPQHTALVAKAAFPKGTTYMKMRDELGTIFEDEDFAHLFPTRGQPAMAPWRLALVTIMQFAEGLSDRQTVEAVRARIDWKYALSLELTDAGFDDSVLSEFRSRLLEGEAERLLFDHMLERYREMGMVKAKGRQRTDSTHILAVVRGLNRLELAGETVRHALDALSTVAPEWLAEHVRPEWVERYVRRLDNHRLPKGKEARQAEAETIGDDGYELLDTILFGDGPAWLREVPAVQTLRRVWVQNYVREQDGSVRWRTSEEGIPPAAKYINHPKDTDARYGRKSTTTSWVGYRVHLTETCEDDLPNIITDVQTAPAPVADGDATPIIHETLKEKELLPETQFVDTGYLDAELLAQSKQNYGVELYGPTRQNHRGKAQAEQGFGVANFEIDWEREKAICPEGQESIGWSSLTNNNGDDVIRIKFSTSDCSPCPSRELCTLSNANYPSRNVTVYPKEQHEALMEARQREKTAEFKEQYAKRAGIEGTVSRSVRTCEVRRSRYIGLAKTHAQHLLTATSLNFLRVGEWLADVPKAKTRRSPFARLMSGAAAA